MKRPTGLVIYTIIIWISKLALIGGNLYFIKYVLDHKDFYLGIGFHDTTIQQFLLMAGSLVVLAGTVGMLNMKKRGFKIYLAGKLLEAIALFWAWPSYSGVFTHSFRGMNDMAFTITFLLMLICLTLIFPLIYYTFSKKFR